MGHYCCLSGFYSGHEWCFTRIREDFKGQRIELHYWLYTFKDLGQWEHVLDQHVSFHRVDKDDYKYLHRHGKERNRFQMKYVMVLSILVQITTKSNTTNFLVTIWVIPNPCSLDLILVAFSGDLNYCKVRSWTSHIKFVCIFDYSFVILDR